MVLLFCALAAGWDYLVTRSIANNYPRGDLIVYFNREAKNMCPFLRWDAPYLSDAFLRVPTSSSCGVVLDVGANIGLSTLPPAARGWQVIAFEPNPENGIVRRSC